MRFLAFFALALAGCTASNQEQSTSNWSAPTSYSAATAQATDPPLDTPVGPWDCEPVRLTGVPGSTIQLRHSNGATSYTADANGNFISMLVQPRSTLWIVVTAPNPATVTWTGTQFTSIDGIGATWTAPSVCNFNNPETVITIIATPTNNG